MNLTWHFGAGIITCGEKSGLDIGSEIQSWSVKTKVERIYTPTGIIEAVPPVGKVSRVEIIPARKPPNFICVDDNQTLLIDNYPVGKIDIETDITALYLRWHEIETQRVQVKAITTEREKQLEGLLKQTGFTKDEIKTKVRAAIETAAKTGDYSLDNIFKLAVTNGNQSVSN